MLLYVQWSISDLFKITTRVHLALGQSRDTRPLSESPEKSFNLIQTFRAVQAIME